VQAEAPEPVTTVETPDDDDQLEQMQDPVAQPDIFVEPEQQEDLDSVTTKEKSHAGTLSESPAETQTEVQLSDAKISLEFEAFNNTTSEAENAAQLVDEVEETESSETEATSNSEVEHLTPVTTPQVPTAEIKDEHWATVDDSVDPATSIEPFFNITADLVLDDPKESADVPLSHVDVSDETEPKLNEEMIVDIPEPDIPVPIADEPPVIIPDERPLVNRTEELEVRDAVQQESAIVEEPDNKPSGIFPVVVAVSVSLLFAWFFRRQPMKETGRVSVSRLFRDHQPHPIETPARKNNAFTKPALEKLAHDVDELRRGFEAMNYHAEQIEMRLAHGFGRILMVQAGEASTASGNF
jgi:hypothetical protein